MQSKSFIIVFSLCCLPLFCDQALATFFDGMEAYRQSDYQTALREFKSAGEDAKALYMVGVMNEKGEGIPVNYSEAVSWYRQSAEKGNAVAQYRLGRLYERGLGVEKSIDDAIKLYKRAAKQGQADAKQALKRVEAK